MFESLPKSAHEVMARDWSQFAPYFESLEQESLSTANVEQWLTHWSRLSELLNEVGARLHLATTQDTTDEAAETAFKTYLEQIQPAHSSAEQKLKEKLLASKLEPAGLEIALRNMRTQAEIFREANIPLKTEVSKLGLEYERIVGAQTVEWAGEEITMARAYSSLGKLERAQAEALWRQLADRHLQDRAALNALWQKLLPLRQQMAENAGFDDFRAYQWKNFGRFDYSPADCETFHAAIEAVVVPAATRVYQRRSQARGSDNTRPWDLQRDNVYPPAQPTLHPYKTIEDLEAIAETIFQQVDSQLGDYFGIMRREKLLDLDNRKGKGPGGYCTHFPVAQRPFIFMNAVGSEDDVKTLMHEAGHAFHAFESDKLAYSQQKDYPIEFAEVASMAMELLSAPYWAASQGGYYDDADLVHARRSHLEDILIFWPYMAVVDAFQHWAYTHVGAAMDPAQCDAQWAALFDRFIPGVDWSGLEAMKATGWHRKLHIFHIPFYYVDYGLAQLGAVQVWRNAQADQAQAVDQYLEALALGGTASLPELFTTAGARFAFDTRAVREAVDLIEGTLSEMGVG